MPVDSDESSETKNIAREHYLNGMRLLKSGKKRHATEEFKKSSELCPDYLEPRRELVVIHRQNFDADDAILELKEILKRRPRDIPAHIELGHIYLDMGDLSHAELVFRKAIDIDCNNSYLHQILGCTIKMEIDSIDAAAELKGAVHYSNFNYPLYDRLSYEEAVTELRTATRLDINNSDAHAILGLLLAERYSTYTESIDEIKQAINLKPDDAKYHYYLAKTLMCYSDYNEALDEFNMVIKIEPAYEDAYLRLSRCYTYINNYEKSIQILEQGTHSNPDSSVLHYKLGSMQYYAGRYDEAMESLERATWLDTKNADAHYLLGGIYFSQERYEDALKEYNKASSLNPEDYNIQHMKKIARNKVRELKSG